MVATLTATPVLPLEELCTTLGESAYWDAEAGKLRFVDIVGNKLYAYEPSMKKVESWDVPEGPAALAGTTDANTFLVAYESGITQVRVDGKSLSSKLLGPPGMKELNVNGRRFNEGRLDRQGRLVVGGFGTPQSDGACAFECDTFQLQLDGTIRILDMGFRGDVEPYASRPKHGCANTTCFSPDGSKMYFHDTAVPYTGGPRRIYEYDYDPKTGTPSNPKLCIDMDALGLMGMPDSGTVDAEGGIWFAACGSSSVYRFLPDGTHSMTVQLPGCCVPTCCAIGGKDLDTLYVTSMTQYVQEMGGTPETSTHVGALFEAKIPVKGLPEPKYPLPYLPGCEVL